MEYPERNKSIEDLHWYGNITLRQLHRLTMLCGHLGSYLTIQLEYETSDTQERFTSVVSDLCLPFKCLRGINKPVQSLPCPATYCTSMIDAVSLHCLQGQVAIWGPGLLFATLNTRCCGQINPKAQQQHSSFQGQERLADRRPVILQPNSAQSEPNPGTLRRTRPSGPEPARSPGCCVALAARNQAVQTGSPESPAVCAQAAVGACGPVATPRG